MGWHNSEMGAMAFFTPASDFEFRDLVAKIAAHKPDAKVYGQNDVDVLECIVLLGHGDIVCRLHAPRRDGKGGAERITDWVNSVINANGIKDHIRDSHTYVVGYEATPTGMHST